jgi:hypothetical protein
MGIKRKTCDIRTWRKHVLLDISSTNIDTLVPLLLSVSRNPQHRSLLTFISATSAPLFLPLLHQQKFCHPFVNRFTQQTLPTVNRKHFFMNILCIESFCLQKAHNRTLLFGVTLLKHGRHFDY